MSASCEVGNLRGVDAHAAISHGCIANRWRKPAKPRAMKGQIQVQFFDKVGDEQNNNEIHVAVRSQEAAWKIYMCTTTHGALSI
jgi:hypothetical protein